MNCISTSLISDILPEKLQYAEPIFKSFGKKSIFFGQILIHSCYENCPHLNSILSKSGKGFVLIIDAIGSFTKPIIDEKLAFLANSNNWEGIIINGCVRNPKKINNIDIGIKALDTLTRKINENFIFDQEIFDKKTDFGGIFFKEGDFLISDNDGIITYNKGEILKTIESKF